MIHTTPKGARRVRALWAACIVLGIGGCSGTSGDEGLGSEDLVVGGGGAGPSSASSCGVLPVGAELTTGQSLASCDGRFILTMQPDDNLVLYDANGPLWATRTVNTGSVKAAMQGDGNFVLYTAQHKAKWASNTSGNEGAHLALQNDGNLVIYSSSGKALWSSHTCCHPAPPSTTWPNAESHANSDPWIATNHDSIRAMSPRVLAINFAIAQTVASMTKEMNVLASNVNEASRYHGYKESSAPAFFNYSIAKAVDAVDHADHAWNNVHLNGRSYPVKCNPSDWYQFHYAALFSQDFADKYGFVDSSNPSHNLRLDELVERGIVHEIWLFIDGNKDPYQCSSALKMPDFQTAEVLEYKQKYNAAGSPLAHQFEPCAGNGCLTTDDLAPFKAMGRSLRILYVNSTRGSGAALHSLGHGVESMATTNVIPYFTNNFRHFGNFDFEQRLHLAFPNWYGCDSSSGPCAISYLTSNSLVYDSGATGPYGEVSSFNQGCGNVHFPPNARDDYDDVNEFAVLSTCEHFGLHDGPGGADVATLTNANAWSKYNAATQNESTGGWNVYWRQNYPGLDNAARSVEGGPMKNWWPFLFY